MTQQREHTTLQSTHREVLHLEDKIVTYRCACPLLYVGSVASAAAPLVYGTGISPATCTYGAVAFTLYALASATKSSISALQETLARSKKRLQSELDRLMDTLNGGGVNDATRQLLDYSTRHALLDEEEGHLALIAGKAHIREKKEEQRRKMYESEED